MPVSKAENQCVEIDEEIRGPAPDTLQCVEFNLDDSHDFIQPLEISVKEDMEYFEEKLKESEKEDSEDRAEIKEETGI